jgi:hypothetical protein
MIAFTPVAYYPIGYQMHLHTHSLIAGYLLFTGFHATATVPVR